MSRYPLSALLLGLGLALGCPAPTDKKCPPREGPCAAGTTCDESDGVCKPDASPDDCTSRPSLCTDSQSCDAASKACVDNPPAPSPTGALLDRMGRPAINTALTNPFDKSPVSTNTDAKGDDTKDAYNKDGNVASWVGQWSPRIVQNLAVLDALDGPNTADGMGKPIKGCGNQFAADAAMPRYSLLSQILAGDALHLDTSKKVCAQYLAVEAGVPNDCGGRRLDYDVIDTTYSVLASGTLSGVTDGIANDSSFLSGFPFLAAPQTN